MLASSLFESLAAREGVTDAYSEVLCVLSNVYIVSLRVIFSSLLFESQEMRLSWIPSSQTSQIVSLVLFWNGNTAIVILLSVKSGVVFIFLKTRKPIINKTTRVNSMPGKVSRYLFKIFLASILSGYLLPSTLLSGATNSVLITLPGGYPKYSWKHLLK